MVILTYIYIYIQKYIHKAVPQGGTQVLIFICTRGAVVDDHPSLAYRKSTGYPSINDNPRFTRKGKSPSHDLDPC